LPPDQRKRPDYQGLCHYAGIRGAFDRNGIRTVQEYQFVHNSAGGRLKTIKCGRNHQPILLPLLQPAQYGQTHHFPQPPKNLYDQCLQRIWHGFNCLNQPKNPSMTDKHYYDKEVTRDEAKENFSVFKKKAKK